MIQYNQPLRAECEVQSKVIYCANGTEIKALSSEYSTAAGSNHGMSSWDELWAYTSEGSRRLWEELTPVPTRRNSIRFISTYAGFTNTDRLVVAGHRIWQPQPGQILDLGSTLEFFIRGLSQRAQIVKLLYDPSQAQRSMQMLREMWIDVEELPQTQNNLSVATQSLYDYLINRQVRIYPNQELRAHVLNASTKRNREIFPAHERESEAKDRCLRGT